MTKRAILYCGQVKQPLIGRDERGQPYKIINQETGLRDPLCGTDDSKIQCNSLELAFKAALKLGVPSNEIHASVLSDELLPQGFVGRHHLATVDGLRDLVRSLARQAKPEDALLFIAVNHGGKKALATADPVDEFEADPAFPQLTPEVLDDCLRPLSGPQVVVVAACHAGIFLPLGKREGRAVLVSCAADEVTSVSREDCAWPAFLDELFGAWCGSVLSDAVPCTRLPLDDAFARAEERLRAEKAERAKKGDDRATLPLRAGTAAWPA